MKFSRTLLLTACLILGFFSVSIAQVTIAPVAVFLDDQNRFGTMLVLNGSNQTQEITIDFPFGYPAMVSPGQNQMVYDNGDMAEKYSIEESVRVFPKNFTLPPGERQVVRLTLRPQNREAGTYWTRIRTTSTPQQPPIGEAEQGVTAQITYKFQQITTLFYKTGNVDTGLKITSTSHQQRADTTLLNVEVSRTGNSPFIGTLDLTITDANGKEVLNRTGTISIYFDLGRQFKFTKSELPAGSYTAEFRFSTQRNDISSENLIQTSDVTGTYRFTVR